MMKGLNTARVTCGFFPTDTRKALSIQCVIHYVGVMAKSNQLLCYEGIHGNALLADDPVQISIILCFLKNDKKLDVINNFSG